VSEPIEPNPVFGVLRELGDVTDREMYQTFNMGMGFALVVPEDQASDAVESAGKDARIVGRAVEGGKVTVPSLDIEYVKY